MKVAEKHQRDCPSFRVVFLLIYTTLQRNCVDLEEKIGINTFIFWKFSRGNSLYPTHKIIGLNSEAISNKWLVTILLTNDDFSMK